MTKKIVTDPETLRHVRDTLRAEKPALVLLDLMLPGTDGIELMQTVPESPASPS